MIPILRYGGIDQGVRQSKTLLEECAEQFGTTGKIEIQRVHNSTQHRDRQIDDRLKRSRLAQDPLNKKRVDLSSKVQAIAADLQEQQPARRLAACG
jgi:hypothetical protein